jgi:hypothetical protein
MLAVKLLWYALLSLMMHMLLSNLQCFIFDVLGRFLVYLELDHFEDLDTTSRLTKYQVSRSITWLLSILSCTEQASVKANV